MTQDNWISVEDDLPKWFEPVLGYIDGKYFVCWRACDDAGEDCYTVLNTDHVFGNITHWQPLPKPPIK